MKKKLGIIILLFIVAAPIAAFAHANADEENPQPSVTHSDIAAVDQLTVKTMSTDPAVVPGEQKQTSDNYQAAMIAITQRFSATLASIAEGVQRGNLTSGQAKEMSVELYQVAQMQFQLLSLWREIEERDSAQTPDAQEDPALTQDNEIVMVALPFSSLQLNPSLAEYLNLTPTQAEAIRQLMTRERETLHHLTTQIQITGKRLLAMGGDHINQNELKGLAKAEAALLAKLIVANARLQSKIYKILNSDQQTKLKDLERNRESITVTGK
jgi:LTXXQ motif family protein